MRIFLMVYLALFVAGGALASGAKMDLGKNAIVIASFGTTYETTINSILDIASDIQAAAPKTEVRLAFTSNIIRKIWHKRAGDADYKKSHPQVPEYLYDVKNVLGTMADLQNQGYKNIVVQPTLLVNGEEFHDLRAYVKGLAGIRTLKRKWQPFLKVGLGEPLTGNYDYHGALETFAKALEADVKKAAAMDAVLVYMGHGNEHMSTGIYYEMQLLMNKMYKQAPTVVGVVEGHPTIDEVIEKAKATGKKKAMLKPLMIVAGDHANNDMASDEEDSWKIAFQNAGFEAVPVLEGLGDNPKVRAIFVDHMKNAAAKAHIELK
jgi:sirohydrochlorin cobaltochelatase